MRVSLVGVVSAVVLAWGTACGSGNGSDGVAGDAGAPDGASVGETSVDAARASDGGSALPLADGGANVESGDPPSSCHPVAAAHPDEGAAHTASLCVPTNYATKPPSSGMHYGVWAAYKSYAETFPQGFWVHNLEHGAVVITYNCPEGCPDEVGAAQALIDALPADPFCSAPVRNRLVMLPDPTLDVRFAASSWGFTLRADCFDREAFTEFIATHYNHGLEDICSDGLDPLTGSGGMPICGR